MLEKPSRRDAIFVLGGAFAVLPVASFSAEAKSATSSDIVEVKTVTGRMSTVTHWRAAGSKGTILFSHGAASAPSKYDRIILPWVSAGYDVWAPLHVDSPEHPDTKSFPGTTTWRARIEDMRALAAHVGGRYISAGHSYGGLTALSLGGAAADLPEGISGPLRDPNAIAVVAFSPPGPIPGLISAEGYAGLAVPALIQTGDKDVPLGKAPATADGWKVHLAAYEAAAAGGDRYALVLEGVNHFFGGLICWLDQPGPPQSAQLDRAADLSRLFIDAYGTRSKRARRLLDAQLRDSGPVILRKK